MSEEKCDVDLSNKKKITKENKFHDGANPELLIKPKGAETDRIKKKSKVYKLGEDSQ